MEDAADENIDVIMQFADGESASRFARHTRPDWDQLLTALDARAFDILILWEPSRGDRDAETWLGLLGKCRRAEVRIRVTSHCRTYDLSRPSDWKALADDGIDSAYESEKTSLRMKRHMRASAKKGRPHARTPYGYIRLYDEHTKEFVGQVPDERLRGEPDAQWSPAGVVRFIYQQMMAEASVTGIVNHLNDTKIPPPRLLTALEAKDSTPRKYRSRRQPVTPIQRWEHLQWKAAVVHHLALNPAYMGIRRHHADTTDGVWDGLVDEETFRTVTNRLTVPGRVLTRAWQAKYLMSCIADCAVCGDDMVHLKPDDGHLGKRIRRAYSTYRCRRSHVTVPAEAFDNFVEETLLEWLADPAQWVSLQARQHGDNERITEARTKWERFKGELAEWRTAMENADPLGRPSVIMFTKMEQKLLAQIAEAELEMRPRGVNAAVLEFLGKTVAEVATLWASKDLDFQRAVIRHVMNVKVKPCGKGRRHVPITTRVVITPKLWNVV